MIQICAACDGLIDGEAVLVAEEHGASGPGWKVYTHPEHVTWWRPDPRPAAMLRRIRGRRGTS